MKVNSVPHRLSALTVALVLAPGIACAQLLDHLEAFGSSVSLIDSAAADPGNLQADGPKELASADFDGDGRPDLAASKTMGRVAVTFGEGGKEFSPARFLDPPEGSGELRGIAAADFNGDSRPDLAVAAPYSGRVVVFFAGAAREFSGPHSIEAWRGVRNLLALDLDGDGDKDLLAAGPVSGGHFTVEAGIRALINDGSGTFSFAPGGHLPLAGGEWRDQFPRPVFSLVALPGGIAGAARAVVTHANSDHVWIISMSPSGELEIAGTIPGMLPTRALAVGVVTSQDGPPDLLQAARDENQVLVRRADGAGGFLPEVAQRLYVPGAPRALALADVDADGWKDLLVVLRDFDRVVTFRNEEGSLTLAAEAPVGSSPRDLAAVDFNGDGRPDLAVSNRRSDNITVLLAQDEGPGFERLDMVYDVDGGVSGLALADLNGDGRDDVIQAHIMTQEISVRLAGGGALGPARFTKLASPPVAFHIGDLSNDGKTDLMVVHSDRSRPGMSILLGDGGGGFAPPGFFESLDGGLFSVVVADFDGDGVKDAAVGNYDCRLTMFRGLADGEFEKVKLGLFAYEARAMVAGDFDQDGDLDLAGASANGTMTVVENDGTLLAEPVEGTPETDIFPRREYDSPVGKGRIKSMVVVDWNGDDDPDLAINSEDGVSVFVGGEGLTFEALPEALPGTRGSSDLVRGDFDGDGVADLATACRLLSCVAILKGRDGGGSYDVARIVPVPAADHIAAGDIDGDGKADLAGTGEVLWVALSSRAPGVANGAFDPSRPARDAVVINEVLASNKTIELGGKTPDALELYNGRDWETDLSGWTLTYQAVPEWPDGPEPPAQTYRFPQAVSIGVRGRLVLIADDAPGYLHTPFKLAREGATLTLRDASGQEVDQLSYPKQDEDVSYGRFTDGAELLVAKEAPDVGAPNYSRGTIQPDFKSVSVEPATVVAAGETGASPRLLVKADDEVGIFTLTAVWRTLDGARSGRLGLFDDGMHDDRESLDGWFAGVLPALPAGAKVEFFLQASNLIDEEETSPGDPVFSLPGLPVTNYAFAIADAGVELPPLEISEVQASRGGYDELGQRTDYVEIRNTGERHLDLDGLALRDSVFNAEKSHALNGALAPAEHRVYYADGSASAGGLHLPYKLDKEGDAVWLVEIDSRGVVTVVERVSPPDSSGAADSWSRLGPGGPFVELPPSQGGPNVLPGRMYLGLLPPAEGGNKPFLRVGLAAPRGSTPVIETFTEDAGGAWVPERGFAGNGFEMFADLPVEDGTRLFRVKE